MAEYTTGHCPNHNQPGGCQLHNLQCGWPNCDRKPVEHNPPAAASVSERARELEQAQRLAVSLWERNYKESSPDWKVDETLTGVLLQISNMVSGMSLRSNADNRFADLVVSLRDRAKWGRGGRFTSPHDSKGTSRLLDMAADALEQALTQQRGESSRPGMSYWAVQMPGKMPKLYGAYAFAELNWYPDEGGALVRLQEVERIGEPTPPQPSADAVRELVKRILNWQPLTSINKADRLYQILIAAGIPFESVTDELESLLSAASGEKGVG